LQGCNYVRITDGSAAINLELAPALLSLLLVSRRLALAGAGTARPDRGYRHQSDAGAGARSAR